MARDKEKGQLDGFIINNVIFLIAMFIGSLFPVLARTVLSFMIKTPSASELRADGSFLFDVIYPIAGFVTLAAFIFGGWYCSYVAFKKVSFKTGRDVDRFKIKIQLIAPSILMLAWNVYMGFADKFTGFMGFQFWYPAAVTSSLFGVIDKTDLLGTLSSLDLVSNSFVLDGLAYSFPWLTIFFGIVYSAVFSVACYFGRIKGMAAGIVKMIDYLLVISGELKNP